MSLSHEHLGSKIPAKINTFMLTKAELLIHLCYEIPCTLSNGDDAGGDVGIADVADTAIAVDMVAVTHVAGMAAATALWSSLPSPMPTWPPQST